MIKVLIGFILFAAVAIFILTRSGADVDLGGEKHGVDASHGGTPAASAPAAPAAPASAASGG